MFHNLSESSMEPNVAILTTSYLPKIGGLVTYAQNVAKAIVSMGGTVTIYCATSGHIGESDNGENAEVKVQGSNALDIPALLRPIRPFAIVSRLRRQLEMNLLALRQSDLIVVRHVYYAWALSSFPDLIQRSVLLVPSLDGRLIEMNSNKRFWLRRMYNKMIALQVEHIERSALKKFRLATLSKSKRDEIIDAYGVPEKKIAVIPPGVDLNRFWFANIDAKNMSRRNLGADDDMDKFLILVVARLYAEKNIDNLIRAIAVLGDPNATVWVIGDGPLRGDLVELSRKLGVRVRFWGIRRDVDEFFRAADVTVLPSYYEGFGHVFLESLASGTPIIGVKNDPPGVITATEEIVRDGYNGWIAANPSAEGLASCLRLAREQISDSMRAACRSDAEARFSWTNHVRMLMEQRDSVMTQ